MGEHEISLTLIDPVSFSFKLDLPMAGGNLPDTCS